MAYSTRQHGAVQRIEMKFLHSFQPQPVTERSGDICRSLVMEIMIIMNAIKKVIQPTGHLCAAHGGKFPQLHDVGDGENSRDNRYGNACLARFVHKPEVGFRLEEKLGDGAGGASINLAF